MGKILIVDDSIVEIKILESILARTDHQLMVARNGEEGETLAKSFRPDFIFLDVVMPKKNGFQVCRDLRRDPQFTKTPIVLLTSKSQDIDKFWGKQQGATEYITKPYDGSTILKIVNKYL
ncbi:two-component system response regulator [candidate division KSB3 bacterium]|uniref:Two-component system response regulator n=1 Tax=candidate division KSB3 bacterium TaxID=2044937 RepID=A0A2G6E9U8_9BACT|nr:MAG: two-component system response regulator [candidate division KSB3 bacterium]PIE29570.1 MAG: two-component system response regulator [candidate division KSB3 bacterium]